jgi:hypothetical protein
MPGCPGAFRTKGALGQFRPAPKADAGIARGGQFTGGVSMAVSSPRSLENFPACRPDRLLMDQWDRFLFHIARTIALDPLANGSLRSRFNGAGTLTVVAYAAAFPSKCRRQRRITTSTAGSRPRGRLKSRRR